MDDIAIGGIMGILILLQMFIIQECVKMKSTVSTGTSDLRTEMTNLGTLLDEALDYLNDLEGSAASIPPVIQGMGGDFKTAILTSLMNKMTMPPEHASQKQEEWQVREEQPKTLETEIESP